MPVFGVIAFDDMCDTFIALPAVTQKGNTLLGKNSDREPDEAQQLSYVPASTQLGDKQRCTFIEIPSAGYRYECILSKPFQMWGAEMGVNEWGVAIGNEAVFTKVGFKKDNSGLTGMDLLRLALERSKSADEAVEWITRLLEEFGQDACGGYRNRSFFYHNSFLVADASSAWVVETADRQWALEKVTGIRSISNRLSIHRPDRLSKGTETRVKSRDFARAYSDWFYTFMGRAAQRQDCTFGKCESLSGRLEAKHCFEILQTHNLPDPAFRPSRANTGSVCMHATNILNPSDTTGSMVAEIRVAKPSTVWATGTPHPCLSVFIPFFFQTDVIQRMPAPGAAPDQSLWWKARVFHQRIAKHYQREKTRFDGERKALQESFLLEEHKLLSGTVEPAHLQEFSRDCLYRYEQALDQWIRQM